METTTFKSVERTQRHPSATVVMAGAAIAASAVALLFLAGLHALSPEFDPTWRMVSEYALGQYGWVLSLMFAFWAVGSWALAFTVRSRPRTTGGRIGWWLLVVAGVGEALAAVFDVRNAAMHSLAAFLGILGLPIAAMLISVSLGRSQGPSGSRNALLWTANLTWISVVLMAAAMIVMTIGFTRAGGVATPDAVVKKLPPGVIALVGVANRLLVAAYCLWAMVAAWQAARAARS